MISMCFAKLFQHSGVTVGIFLTSLLFSISVFSETETMIDKEAPLEFYSSTPAGWKTEVIEFPLGFASDFSYRGKEELVFMPGMYEIGSEDFFSYAFVWVVKTEKNIPLNSLQEHLLSYYSGLQKAVSKNTLTDNVVVVIKKQTGNGASNLANTRAEKWRGTIAWSEPFKTKKAQTLRFKLDSFFCEKQNRWLGFFLVSPHGYSHKVWSGLDSLNKEYLACIDGE